MLQDSFIEVHYKRDNGAYGVLFKVFIITAAVIFMFVLNAVPILLGYNIIYVTGLISFGLSYLVYRIIKNQNKEYEIEISNDAFDVARIIGGKKREELASFSIRECEFIGPTSSDRYAEDTEKSEFVLNVTDGRMIERSEDVWYSYVVQGNLKYVVAYVFKEEMYPVFRRYNPRKVAPHVIRETVTEEDNTDNP